MPNIHPTAVVDSRAQIADDVQIGPYCVIEPDVSIGAHTRLAEHVIIRRYTALGEHNQVDAFCVLGGLPQDYKFDPASVTYLRIGDHNVFREGITISRATGEGHTTVVGNRTYWMALAHAGHNATVEDEAILVNGAALGGHSTLGRRAILSAHVVIHQFCWIGEMVMTQGNGGTSTHIPPFCLASGINRVVGLNAVGLRRNTEITDEDRRQIKEAFRLTYRSHQSPTKALEQMDACNDWGAQAGKFREFIRRVVTAEKPFNRGLCPLRAERGATI